MTDYSAIRGFNYQPSYALNTYEAWRFFDESVFRRELHRGKKFFPGINTIRLWVSYDAFRYEEDRQAANFRTALEICAEMECKAIPCLFNCWHDTVMDNGGIYHPDMIDGSIWSSLPGRFDSFFDKIVAPYKNDERILLWDICNEPFSYATNQVYRDFMHPYEVQWLGAMCALCRDRDGTHPIGISLPPVDECYFDDIAPFVDIFLVHPYYFTIDTDLDTKSQEGFALLLQNYQKIAQKYQLPILTTETCWGSEDDSKRAEIIRRTLDAHTQAGLGFVVHALQYSLVADLHDRCDGIVGQPGNLCFVRKDGTLRPGHEIFNKY